MDENGIREVRRIYREMHQENMKKKRIIYGVVLLFIGIALFYTMSKTVITFDTAMNYQVSKHLADNGEYATFYHEYQLFDHNIQTGSPVIFPTAILNMLFGNSTVHMQIITTLYLLLFIGLVMYLIDQEAGMIAAILGGLLILSYEDVWLSSLVGFGEFSMAFWLFLCFILFFRARERESTAGFIAAGICFGIGYLDKTVFFICLPACFLFVCYDLFIKKKAGIKQYLIFILGALIPVLLFECYRLVCLGGSGYLEWWEFELSAILGEAGVSDKLEVKESVGTLVRSHMNIYASVFRMNPLMILFTYLMPGVYLVYDCLKNKKLKERFFLFYMVSMTYIVWWMAITPTARAWSRRVVIGHAIILMLVVIALGDLAARLWRKASLKKAVGAVGAGAVLCVSGYYGMQLVDEMQRTTAMIGNSYEEKIEAEGFSEVIKALPEETVLYGYGWWQNPVIADLSDRVMYDLEKTPEPGDNAYMVVDYYMLALASDTVGYLKSLYYMEPVYKLGSHGLYKIHADRETAIKESGSYLEVFYDGIIDGNQWVYYDDGSGYTSKNQEKFSPDGIRDSILADFRPGEDTNLRLYISSPSDKVRIKSIAVTRDGQTKEFAGQQLAEVITKVIDIEEVSVDDQGIVEFRGLEYDAGFDLGHACGLQ